MPLNLSAILLIVKVNKADVTANGGNKSSKYQIRLGFISGTKHFIDSFNESKLPELSSTISDR